MSRRVLILDELHPAAADVQRAMENHAVAPDEAPIRDELVPMREEVIVMIRNPECGPVNVPILRLDPPERPWLDRGRGNRKFKRSGNLGRRS